MIIRDDSQSSNQKLTASGILGPYDEDSRVELTCEAESDEPQANISWWHLKSISTIQPTAYLFSTNKNTRFSKAGGEQQQILTNSGDLESSNYYLTTMTLNSGARSLEGDNGSNNDNIELVKDYFVSFHSSIAQLKQDSLILPFQEGYKLKHWLKVPDQSIINSDQNNKLQASVQISLSRFNIGDEYICLASSKENSIPLNITAKINLNRKYYYIHCKLISQLCKHVN